MSVSSTIAGAVATVSREKAQSLICSQMTRACRSFYGDRLRAVVLTGSLARGEGSFTRREGVWQVLGDSEFIVVLHAGALGNEQELAREVKESLPGLGVISDVSISVAKPSYLADLQPHIFAYELREHGRVLWGDQNILSLIPSFLASDIPVEDGWRMLSNRLIEFLEAIAGGCDYRSSYHTIKLYMDMATSLLVFARAYDPSYALRARRLEDIARFSQRIGGIDLRNLARRVSFCTALKLSGEIPGNIQMLADLRLNAIKDAALLWHWELGQLTRLSETSSTAELMCGWMRRQSVAARMRGWAYVARRSGWLKKLHHWPRWGMRCFKSSPRYRVYACAGELAAWLSGHFAGTQVHANESTFHRQIAALLPVDRTSGGCSDWQSLAREIGWNYHEFLERTRS